MVKKIRKRVVKKEAAPEPTPEEQGLGLVAEADDEFTQYTARVLEWIHGHRKLVVGGVAGATLLFAGIAFYSYRVRSGVEADSAAFSAAAEAYTKARTVRPPPTLIPGQPPPAPAPDLSPAERKTRLEAARAAFEAAAGSGERPIEALAKLGLAGTKLDLGEHDAALALYKDLVADTRFDPFTRAIILQAQAIAFEQASKREDAIATWRTLAKLDARAYGLLANLQIGRIFEDLKRPGDAKKQYLAIQKEHAKALEDFSNRRIKAEVERRLARLEAGS